MTTLYPLVFFITLLVMGESLISAAGITVLFFLGLFVLFFVGAIAIGLLNKAFSK